MNNVLFNIRYSIENKLSGWRDAVIRKRFEKLPMPTNKALNVLFENVDKITIKEDGAFRKAVGKNIVLSITDPKDIKRFSELLEIQEPLEAWGCMCSGDYAIELRRHGIVRATIGFHHGFSIRIHKCKSDAELTRADALLQFMSDLGLRQPLIDRLESIERNKASQQELRDWLGASPRCFSNYVELSSYQFPLARIETELRTEIPDPNARILSLLRSYAKTKYTWSGYSSYETLPYQLLDQLDIEDIMAAYLASDRNYNARKGLGRYLFYHDFLKNIPNLLKHIPWQVVDELQACFEKLGDEQGKSYVEILRQEKEMHSDTSQNDL